MSFFKYSAYLVIMIFILSCSQDTDMLSTSYPTTDNTVSDVGDLKDLDNDGLAKWGRDLPIRVMTRNIYIGTDVDVILSAPDPTQIPVLTAQAFQEWQSTNFPERARSLAIEIALTRPDVIGLQEAFTIRLQSPGDATLL